MPAYACFQKSGSGNTRGPVHIVVPLNPCLELRVLRRHRPGVGGHRGTLRLRCARIRRALGMHGCRGPQPQEHRRADEMGPVEQFCQRMRAFYTLRMNKTRLEAFTDGVIAILITIMVLELKAPEGGSWEELRALQPV